MPKINVNYKPAVKIKKMDLETNFISKHAFFPFQKFDSRSVILLEIELRVVMYLHFMSFIFFQNFDYRSRNLLEIELSVFMSSHFMSFVFFNESISSRILGRESNFWKKRRTWSVKTWMLSNRCPGESSGENQISEKKKGMLWSKIRLQVNFLWVSQLV